MSVKNLLGLGREKLFSSGTETTGTIEKVKGKGLIGVTEVQEIKSY